MERADTGDSWSQQLVLCDGFKSKNNVAGRHDNETSIPAPHDLMVSRRRRSGICRQRA
ncbi:protein of unknown function (plasmid) [Cupriavidus taiwanensis]|uniref:Uncharacterized protein n=1 Tax=Cupriavidus taiwanensis TaxID=164546 RepID=A0A375IR37_9BURK|nr:hypothetical protein CBM2592_U20003 [Cupriavidus taiwanensis]SOZ01009.1 hypothetical protein CBM2591_U20005 [Cupriavidus taiwanensis]SPA53910.1 hypothetical protein CBM2629_U40006 [Cupriavidus taiwanensis]SPD57919.1 protein of unknown function [Cupriavidus taiwanensis]SPK77017.1 protein of unknown function [Cupriavidus taiwanensis]